jgi:hypothetical protein
MARARYSHSAYWYAKNYGYTRSDKATFAERYVDYCTRPARGGGTYLQDFNPLLLGIYAMMDVGVAVKRDVDMLRSPVERDRIKREMMQGLRSLRRPFYYARETERRRRMAAERRKINRRYTTAPAPTPEALLAAWNARKESREAMIRLGGMLHDLECYVDNCLKIDESGAVVGRNGGIRGWIRENLPELSPKYKTLMRYKALAVRLRQATGTRDPTPTSALLEGKRHEAVKEILSDSAPVFSRVFDALEHRLSPDTVFLDPAKNVIGRNVANKRARRRTASKRPSRKRLLR